MHELLKNVLNNFQAPLPQLSPKTLEAIVSRVHKFYLKKGSHFLEAGSISNKVGLLISGVLRTYYISNGREHTSYFNVEKRNPFVASFTSLLTRNPSFEFIQALEDCELMIITHQELQNLYDNHPEMERLGRILAEQNYLMAMERIHDLQQRKADFKYEKFLKLYPGLMNRIPHHYISSYLGITPESLSRIRKRA